MCFFFWNCCSVAESCVIHLAFVGLTVVATVPSLIYFTYTHAEASPPASASASASFMTPWQKNEHTPKRKKDKKKMKRKRKTPSGARWAAELWWCGVWGAVVPTHIHNFIFPWRHEATARAQEDPGERGSQAATTLCRLLCDRNWKTLFAGALGLTNRQPDWLA